ncbi:MAG: pyruvate dehydrogenase complex dihydrolipoamide acetyltransferase [Chthoniobacteraceae bacterium]
MPISIEMPKLSDTMTEGTLVKWRKKLGDKIEMGDVIAEIETDKATMEMEAFDDGTLAEIYVKEGEKVAVGQQIALLAVAGEKPGEAKAAAPSPAVAASTHYQEVAGAPIPGATGAAPAPSPAPAAAAPAPSATPQGRVKASPLARKLAARKGIDLTRVTGTGPGGRIIERDLANAPVGAPAPASPARPAASAAPAAPVAVSSAVNAVPPIPAGPGDRVIPLSGMRRVIAERLVASKSTIPHFYLQIEADAEPLLKLRVGLNAGAEASGRGKITVNDLILKAAVAALVRVPKVNAAWAGDAIIEYDKINLSVAVAVEEGLVTPVIRDVGGQSISEISAAVKDLATRARGKRLKPEEYQGGTFTVSNLGSYGIESFFAIVNPPQSAILSIGAAVKKPVVNAAGQIVPGQRMSIGLSCDHRVVDGALGSQYLGELKNLIENPALMLL